MLDATSWQNHTSQRCLHGPSLPPVTAGAAGADAWLGGAVAARPGPRASETLLAPLKADSTPAHRAPAHQLPGPRPRGPAPGALPGRETSCVQSSGGRGSSAVHGARWRCCSALRGPTATIFALSDHPMQARSAVNTRLRGSQRLRATTLAPFYASAAAQAPFCSPAGRFGGVGGGTSGAA
jgi:hypothetical protein